MHLTHVKYTAPKVKRNLKAYLEEYKHGTSIKELSKKANYPSYLFARFVVEHVAPCKAAGKKGITQAMRDPLGELGSSDIIADEFRESEEKSMMSAEAVG